MTRSIYLVLPVVVAGLSGCGGANEDTLVDELRVMAVVSDPPEVAPAATTTITATVADPLGVEPDVMLWTCTNLGDGCLEAADPAQGTVIGRPVEGQLSTVVTAPVALAGVVSDGVTVLPVLLWTLACAPGVCPAIDLAAAQPAVGSAESETLAEFLADPITGAEALPLTDVSLALSQVRVSMRAAPLQNPVIVPPTDALVVGVGESVEFTIGVEFEGVTAAYGYTTNGGFSSAEYEVVDGEVKMTWFGSDEAGTADLWVVVNGEDGGSAVWHTTGSVE